MQYCIYLLIGMLQFSRSVMITLITSRSLGMEAFRQYSCRIHHKIIKAAASYQENPRCPEPTGLPPDLQSIRLNPVPAVLHREHQSP